MKYFFYVIFIFSLTSQSFFAQSSIILKENSPCKLTLEKSPKLKGLKLGMTLKQVEKSLGMKIKPVEVNSSFTLPNDQMINMIYEVTTKKPIGQSEFFYYPKSTDKNAQGQNQIGGFALAFLDNILAEYVLFYDIKDFDWKKGETKSNVIRKKLGLPTKYRWTYDSYLTCQNFRISIGNYNNGVIRISVINIASKQEIEKRAKKAVAEEEKQKQP